MATITTANNNSALNTSRRSYVAVKAFNNDFFSYTVAMNSSYVNVGTLAVVTTDSALTPAGRVLRENGRKLYPGANPGVTSYLVGVYDAVSPYFSGFIDPNSPAFTIFNSDRPNYLPVGADPTGGLVDSGAPVYTNGSVTAGDGLTLTGGKVVEKVATTAITIPAANAAWNIDLSLGNIINVTAVTNTTAATISNGAKGTVFYLSVTAGAAASFVLPSNVACSQYTLTTNIVVFGAAVTKVLLTCVHH